MRGLSAHPLQSRGHLPPSRLDSPTWCSLDIGTSVCPVGRQGRRHSPFSPLGFQPPHQIGETLRRGEGAELRPFAWLPFSPGVPHVPCLLCSPGLVRLLGTWPPGHSPGGSRAGAYLFLGGAALHPRAPAAAPAQTLLQGCALLEATWVAIRAHPMWGLRTLPGTLHPVPT